MIKLSGPCKHNAAELKIPRGKTDNAYLYTLNKKSDKALAKVADPSPMNVDIPDYAKKGRRFQ